MEFQYSWFVGFRWLDWATPSFSKVANEDARQDEDEEEDDDF